MFKARDTNRDGSAGGAGGDNGLVVAAKADANIDLTASADNLVIVGQIGAPYGVKGWVHLQSFMEDAAQIINFTKWQIAVEAGNWRGLQVDSIKPHGKHFVAKLATIENREQSALLTNKHIAVAREDLPELTADQHYWADLLQLEVFNQDNIRLGIITDVFATGANDVLVVTDDLKEHLIPYVPGQYVLNVDLVAKKVLVAWDREF